MNPSRLPQEGKEAASQSTFPVLTHLPHLTIALTLLAASRGRLLVHVALSPGQGWYQWVLVGGVSAFFAMLVWLWYRTFTAFIQSRKQRRTGESFEAPP